MTEITVSLGTESFVPAPGDYDGDGKTDPAVYQPETGQWRVLFSSTDFATRATFTVEGGTAAVPVPADYDGDGICDAAVYESTTGKWLARLSSLDSRTTTLVTLGSYGDVPVPADYDGDGRTDVAVFHDGDWRMLFSSSMYSAGASIAWGQRGDIPVSAGR